MPTQILDSVDAIVEAMLARSGNDIIAGAPLALGKPNRIINALYRRIKADPSRSLHLLTALSLNPPQPKSDLEKRFLGPFLERHFGSDYPRLEYADDVRRGLPPNVVIEEFYMQSGAMLNVPEVQRHYASVNYTHVPRAVAGRGVNLIMQLVARSPDGTRLSFSCNADTTLDTLDELERLGLPRPLLVAEVHPDLPFMDGDAAVPIDTFDLVLDSGTRAHRLFGLPRRPVSDADYAIGLHASTLVRDNGTLQIGIGTLSDALAHALVLRHRRNEEFRDILGALDPEAAERPLVREWGGLDALPRGLYGASEMVMEGFRHLMENGVMGRMVVEDIEVMRRLANDEATQQDYEQALREGFCLHGAFFLGSHEFYEWLREMPEERRQRIGMTRITQINQLYGGREALERLQRRDARFFNACMMVTALGAAVSDALEDGRVVSGVGGQYNFVAMAHALQEGRSVLMFRAVRQHKGKPVSNIVWSYGHVTIPRHLRDIVVTEYGVADLRDKVDEDCVKAMLSICDARFQDALVAEAKAAGKLHQDFVIPEAWRRNRPEILHQTLKPFRSDGLLPDYPLGSDFTAVEQRLVKALGWLKRSTATTPDRLRTILRALLGGRSDDAEAMARMDFAAPRGLQQKLMARLVALGLRETGA
jgi:acyl-CoA hydrolase